MSSTAELSPLISGAHSVSIWKSPMHSKRPQAASFFLALGLHGILFFAGGVFFARPAEYGMALSQGGMDIELIAAAQTITASSIQEDDMSEAQPVEKKQEALMEGRSTGHDTITFSSSGNGKTEEKPGYLKNPPPAYPRSAIVRGQEGLVLLSVWVDKQGVPQRVAVQQSSGVTALDDSALKTVKKWRFNPGRLGGMAQDMVILVPIRFRLEDLKKH